MKILVVEDDPILALVSAAALADANHEIVGPAHDVVDAQKLIATANIDFAVVDINLAGKDEGIEIARHLDERYGIPTLFVSGQLAAARASQQGAIGLLRKPYEMDELVKSVEYAYQLAHGTRSAAGLKPVGLEIFSNVSKD